MSESGNASIIKWKLSNEFLSFVNKVVILLSCIETSFRKMVKAEPKPFEKFVKIEIYRFLIDVLAGERLPQSCESLLGEDGVVSEQFEIPAKPRHTMLVALAAHGFLYELFKVVRQSPMMPERTFSLGLAGKELVAKRNNDRITFLVGRQPLQLINQLFHGGICLLFEASAPKLCIFIEVSIEGDVIHAGKVSCRERAVGRVELLLEELRAEYIRFPHSILTQRLSSNAENPNSQ